MSNAFELVEPIYNERSDARATYNWLDCIAITGLFVLFLKVTTLAVVDLDMWHEMALAREIFSQGYVPWNDVFSYCETVEPVVDHEWGAGIIAYLVAINSGATGLAILRLCLNCTLATFVWLTARKRGATVSTLNLLLPIAVFLSSYGFSPIRAQMYTYLFIGLMFFLLESERLQSSWWWTGTWLTLYGVWLNLHGGFLAGAALYAAHWLESFLRGRRHWRLFWIGIAMAPLILVNPYGIHYLGYLWNAILMDRPRVDEWHSIWGIGIEGLSCFVLSVCVGLFAFWHAGLRRSQGILVVLISLLATVSARRFLPVYAIAWAIYVPEWLEGSHLANFMDRMWNNLRNWLLTVWLGFIVVFGYIWIVGSPFTLVVPGETPVDEANQILYPVGAVKYLHDTHSPTNLMVSFDTASYVSWKLYPQVKVSVDSRYEVAYPPGAVDENYRLYLAEPGWKEILDEHTDTDAVLVANWFPLAKELPHLDNWHRVYYDASFSIYAQTGSSYPVRRLAGPVLNGTIP